MKIKYQTEVELTDKQIQMLLVMDNEKELRSIGSCNTKQQNQNSCLGELQRLGLVQFEYGGCQQEPFKDYKLNYNGKEVLKSLKRKLLHGKI